MEPRARRTGGLGGRTAAVPARLSAIACVAAGWWAAFATLDPGSASASVTVGTATLESHGRALDAGPYPSTKRFSIALPPWGGCSRGRRSGEQRAFSYLVPQGTDLSSIVFGQLPSKGLGLVTGSGTYYVADGWDAAGPPAGRNPRHGMGPISPSDLEFGPLVSDGYVPLAGSGGLLYTGTEPDASGAWEAGIACADVGATATRFWNSGVTFTYCGKDPNHFVWTSSPGPDPSGNGPVLPEIAWAAALPLAAVAVLGGWLWLFRRRASQTERAVPTERR